MTHPAMTKETEDGHRPMFNHVFPANPLAVRDTLSNLRRWLGEEVAEDVLDRLEIVLAEVFNNIVEHGYEGWQDAPPHDTLPDDGESDETDAATQYIHLCIIGQKGGLSCAVTDDGPILPQECLEPRSLPNMTTDDLPEGGFGWFLIQDLTQSLCYFREGRRNFLAFHVASPKNDAPPP